MIAKFHFAIMLMGNDLVGVVWWGSLSGLFSTACM